MREKTEADLGAPEHHVHTSPRSAVSARRDSARRTRPAPNPRAPGLLAGYTGLKFREAKTLIERLKFQKALPKAQLGIDNGPR